MEIKKVNTVEVAKQAEKFIFEAIKPGGFEESIIPIPQLKDVLAWRTWANLMRPEQPTFAAYDGDKLIGVIVGEPVEQWFDEGESEIQDVIILPEYQTEELVASLFKPMVKFYKENNAKQVHVWCVKEKYEKKDLNLKCKVAIEKFGFEFKGFERISKWTGQEIIKLELLF